MKKLNIVFMGTPDFAVPCLQKLINSSHNVLGVFTQPDKPQGRKMVLTPPPVKVLAESNGIKVYQPEKMKDGKALEIIKELNPDLIIVVAYGKILPTDILEFPKYGCINVHASLLPKYRGAAPIQWAVLNDDKETGITIMQMNEGLDTGDILLTEKTAIGEDETSEELFNRLSVIGSELMLKAVYNIDELTPEPQPEGDFGYASMISKSMSPVNWSEPASKVHAHIRGMYSWPCATTVINGGVVKIHKSKLCDLQGNRAGEVLASNGRLVVCCGDGKSVEIIKLQPQGKKVMDAKAYLAGHTIKKGTVIGGSDE